MAAVAYASVKACPDILLARDGCCRRGDHMVAEWVWNRKLDLAPRVELAQLSFCAVIKK